MVELGDCFVIYTSFPEVHHNEQITKGASFWQLSKGEVECFCCGSRGVGLPEFCIYIRPAISVEVDQVVNHCVFEAAHLKLIGEDIGLYQSIEWCFLN